MRKIFYIVFLFALAAIAGCKEYASTTLTVAYLPDTIPAAGGAVRLDIYSNSNWMIYMNSPEERVGVSQVSGAGNAAVTVQVSANPLARPDAVTLMVASGEVRKYVYLPQAAVSK